MHKDLWWLDLDCPGKDPNNIDVLATWLQSDLGWSQDDLWQLQVSFRLLGMGGYNIPFRPHPALFQAFERKNKLVYECPHGGALEIYGAVEGGRTGAQIAIATSRTCKTPLIGNGRLFAFSDSLAQHLASLAATPTKTTQPRVSPVAGIQSVQFAQSDALRQTAENQHKYHWGQYHQYIRDRVDKIAQIKAEKIRLLPASVARHIAAFNEMLELGGYLAYYDLMHLTPHYLEVFSAAYEVCNPEDAGAEAVRLVSDALTTGAHKPWKLKGDTGPLPVWGHSVGCLDDGGSDVSPKHQAVARDNSWIDDIDRALVSLRGSQ